MVPVAPLGCQWGVWLAEGTAGADAPQKDPGTLSQHLMSGNGSALL